MTRPSFQECEAAVLFFNIDIELTEGMDQVLELHRGITSTETKTQSLVISWEGKRLISS